MKTFWIHARHPHQSQGHYIGVRRRSKAYVTEYNWGDLETICIGTLAKCMKVAKQQHRRINGPIFIEVRNDDEERIVEAFGATEWTLEVARAYYVRLQRQH